MPVEVPYATSQYPHGTWRYRPRNNRGLSPIIVSPRPHDATRSCSGVPYLGDDFLAYIAKNAKERFKKCIALNDLAEAYVRLHHQPRALIDLVLLYSSSNVESLIALLNEPVEFQLMGAQYVSLWRSLKPLHQRICMRIAKGGDVTSMDARVEYAWGSDRSEIPAGTVSDALRALVDAHVLTTAPGGRSRYRLDDPLFAEWLRREDIKLLGQKKR